MLKKILITDKVHNQLPIWLESEGFSVEYNRNVTAAEVYETLPDYFGIIVNSKIAMDQRMIQRGKSLNFIARLGSGMEIINISYARAKGIRVINTPEGNCWSVAEHALGMILALQNHLITADKEVKNLIWKREDNRGSELRGKVIGIIGYGFTGSAFAHVLRGLQMDVLVYDKYKKSYAEQFPWIKETDLGEIRSKADIISFHLPLTKETRHLCNDQFIHSCKKGTIIINTSRGQVIHTPALVKALESKHIAGACLDVFENESPETYNSEEVKLYKQLFNMNNVIVSPHIAGWTTESLLRIAQITLERILSNYSMEA
ncbi:MAG TPA: NAD(P)-dependent oxidoreductase [Saprospiraceae bacterium]|nr:NAD(P)-dependent oxidoreductase [Saprospiraceae bacterium]